ncbi:MAG: AraC family transcriptional regulator [Bacteroidaceae bacterium]|nr:AraC family transcriptional regulator [Bacteroidaceae bacterium]
MERINLTAIPSKVEADYRDNSIALVSDIKRVHESSSDTILVENHLAMIVLNGTATLCVGENEISVQRGDVFVCKPSSILARSMLSIDLEIRGIVVSKEMMDGLVKEVNLSWTLRALTTSHDVVRVDEDELRRLSMYYDLLNAKLNAPSSPRKSSSVKALLLAFVNEFVEVLDKNWAELPPVHYSSAEHIFERYIQLLEDPRQPFVSVNEYAARLNVTSKYFSSVCKRLSGRTAGEILRDEIIKQAKLLLRDNSLGIKQIAARLNFANQSHFGTYFHRYVGMSPQQFRQSGFN